MKLSPWVIYVIGLCVGLPVLAFGYFMHYQPNQEQATATKQVAEQFRTEGAKKKKADERRRYAKALVEKSAREWNALAADRTPPTGVTRGFAPDLSVNTYQLVNDTFKYRNSLQAAINHQLHAGGVTVVSGGYVPDIDLNMSNTILNSFYNYTTFGFPVVILNLGQIQVQGKSYTQIFDHVKAWSNFPHYLAVTDSLALNGTTPNITGTYNLTIVAIIRGKVIAPAVPEMASASGGGFGGGGFGGPPSGFGGPPAGFGGPPAGFGGPSGPPGRAGGQGAGPSAKGGSVGVEK